MSFFFFFLHQVIFVWSSCGPRVVLDTESLFIYLFIFVRLGACGRRQRP